MITSSRKSQESGFQFGGHSSVVINGDNASIYVGRLDNYGEASTPRLQVWALYGAPSGEEIDGVLLAEAETQTLYGGYYLEFISLDAALVDSVRGLYTIALVVTRAGESGSYDDIVVMPDLVDFYHPQLIQPAAAKLSSDGFSAAVAGVSNPRTSGTTSGSLVIELWALANAGGFTGNDFHLGGVEYISAAGGEVSSAIEFNGYPNYPTGKFFPAVVLREWTPAGYLVRDRIVGENAIELPPQGGAVADAFNAPLAQVTAKVSVQEPTLAKAALKDGPTQEKKVAPAKKAAAPAAKKEAAKPAAKEEPKKVEAKKVETKAAAPVKATPAKAEPKKEEPKPAAKKAAKKAVEKKSTIKKASKTSKKK
ncbi:hypothetical protein [Cerasicoccus fimbriatus]|uniref:hypothetical protein n=1 Tax=Cerasicoccus fimbriatus TaxID=3014554 RepID=UPI0022B32B96|nr:hypothetical protein [Cerasicoccus sp. TK19100]